jgi:Aldo/keto reductase family
VGYGAKQLPGPGVFGPPRDRRHALDVLRYVVKTGVNHLDTAYYYGLGVANELIHEALHPYPDDLGFLASISPTCRTGQYAHARGSHRSADPARRVGVRRWTALPRKGARRSSFVIGELITAGVAGSGGRELTVVNDAHGSQVAYNGHLLYIFTYDRPGQVNGQDFQDFFVATPGIAPIAASPASTGTVPALPPGDGYVASSAEPRAWAAGAAAGPEASVTSSRGNA